MEETHSKLSDPTGTGLKTPRRPALHPRPDPVFPLVLKGLINSTDEQEVLDLLYRKDNTQLPAALPAQGRLLEHWDK